MATIRRYADAMTVFGELTNPQHLVDTIATFDWRDSLVAFAQLAAGVANDVEGTGGKAERWARDALLRIDGTNTRAMKHARAWARGGDNAIVVHEEVIEYVQTLIVLYGGETGGGPDDSQMVLWLLAAADHIEAWEQESEFTSAEETIAKLVRVARFNNSENPRALLVRVRETFGRPPFAGELADPVTWTSIQQAGFGRPFLEHFDACVLPYYLKCLSWSLDNKDGYPVIDPVHWVRATGAAGQQTAAWILEQSITRDQLAKAIRKRMRPDRILPQAPTGLLHHPLVRLTDDKVCVSSPWRVITHLRTGIWNAFREGTKKVLGENRGDAWTSGFGYMFEEYLRLVAQKAIGVQPGRLILPMHPGSADEIEDVVVVEGGTAILFSAKARLVEEPVARHAISIRKVMDWYEKYFFSKENGEFRCGAVRQFDARISRIRAGGFPGFPSDLHLVPVLVTYDGLCEEALLYEWLEQRCKHHGLLQQANISQFTIANVDDFERLMACAMRGDSLAAFFAQRTDLWKNRRIQTQLRISASGDLLPFVKSTFKEMVASADKLLARHHENEVSRIE